MASSRPFALCRTSSRLLRARSYTNGSCARCGAGVDMAALAILAAPDSGHRRDLARWIRTVSRGAAQLAQEAASEPETDARLLAAAAWLATDLASICEAAGDYGGDGRWG